FAWRVDPKGVALRLAIGQESKGEYVQDIRRRENAVLAMNAGWFSSDNENYLSPDYALKVSGRILNPYRGETAGGALAIEDGTVRILRPQQIEESLTKATDLVYSKPVMIEPGRKFAMIYNDYDRRSRTAVCTTTDGRFILLATPYPSASGGTKCCSRGGSFVLEQITNITALGDRDDRLSSLVDRVPAAFRR